MADDLSAPRLSPAPAAPALSRDDGGKRAPTRRPRRPARPRPAAETAPAGERPDDGDAPPERRVDLLV